MLELSYLFYLFLLQVGDTTFQGDAAYLLIFDKNEMRGEKFMMEKNIKFILLTHTISHIKLSTLFIKIQNFQSLTPTQP